VNHASAWFYLSVFILLSLQTPEIFAGDMAYAQSPHASNVNSHDIFKLFDEQPSSSWCSTPADGTRTHHVQIALKKRLTIEHIELNLESAPTTAMHVEISNGSSSVAFALTGDELHLKFDKPFAGQVFDFYFKSQNTQTPLCISSLKMLSNGKNLVKLPPHGSMSSSTIMGTWFEGTPGTTEKKLIFAIDGTWSWVHKRFFGKTEKRIRGTYKIHNNILTLRMHGSNRHWQLPLSKERILIDPNDFNAPDFNYDTLLLQGPQPHIIAGSYNNARFDSIN